jgi:hypothetical protein
MKAQKIKTFELFSFSKSIYNEHWCRYGVPNSGARILYLKTIKLVAT